MKNSSSTSILIGVLAICVLASVVLCWFHVRYTGEIRSLQGSVTFINNRRAAVTSLANDAIAYGEKHPDIRPVLIAAGLKPPEAAPATPTNKPAK